MQSRFQKRVVGKLTGFHRRTNFTIGEVSCRNMPWCCCLRKRYIPHWLNNYTAIKHIRKCETLLVVPISAEMLSNAGFGDTNTNTSTNTTTSPLFHVSRSHMGSFHFVKLRSLSLSQLTCPSHSHPVLYLGSELVVAQLPTCALPGIDC